MPASIFRRNIAIQAAASCPCRVRSADFGDAMPLQGTSKLTLQDAQKSIEADSISVRGAPTVT